LVNLILGYSLAVFPLGFGKRLWRRIGNFFGVLGFLNSLVLGIYSLGIGNQTWLVLDFWQIDLLLEGIQPLFGRFPFRFLAFWLGLLGLFVGWEFFGFTFLFCPF